MGTNQAGVQRRCWVLRGAQGASAVQRVSRFTWLWPGSQAWAAGTVGREMLQEQKQEHRSLLSNTFAAGQKSGQVEKTSDTREAGSLIPKEAWDAVRDWEMTTGSFSSCRGPSRSLTKGWKLLKVGVGAGPGFTQQWDRSLGGSSQCHYHATRPGGTKRVYQEMRAPCQEVPPVPSRWSEQQRLGKVTALRAHEYFPGGTVDKNPPANAGDTGSIPSLGRSGMPWGNGAWDHNRSARVLQWLKSVHLEPVLSN